MVLDAYAFSFLPNVSLSYIGLVIFAVLFIIDKFKNKKDEEKKKLYIGPLVLVSLLTLESVINILISSDQSLMTVGFVVTAAKMIIWAISIAYGFKYILKEDFLKYSVRVSMIATLFLIIQTILYYLFSIKVPNGLSFGIIKFVGVDISTFVSAYRPASFFAEPAYYSLFIVLPLCFLLFMDKKKRDLKTILFLSLGIILSTSSAGIYLLAILFAIYMISSSRKNATKLLVLLLIVLPFTILVCLNYASILNNLGGVGDATLGAINKINNYETSSRLVGSYQYMSLLSGGEKLMGYGLGNEYIPFYGSVVYLNSITRLFLQTGIIGVTVFVVYLLSLLKRVKNPTSLFMVITYFIKSVTAGAMFAVGGYYILSLFYLSTDDKKVIEGDNK